MVRPKKHLGQHFLRDHNIARKITNCLSETTQNLLEIGPGTGILTQYLANRNLMHFWLIEIDEESVVHLRSQFPQMAENIVQADFLDYNLSGIFNTKFSVIGNFPYNISSQILFRILDYRNQVQEVIGMFQKEVAERISASAGTKKYGILSVLIQAFFEVEYLFTVSEKVFFPEPRVKSAVIRLLRNKSEMLDCDEPLFFNLVKTAFNQRRKTLRNALSKFEFLPGEKISELLSKRAEQLNVGDFVFLTKQIITSR